MFGVMITKENKFVRKINQDQPLHNSHACFQRLQDMGGKYKQFASSFCFI